MIRVSGWSDRFSEGRLDELYWSSKYAEASCHQHGDVMEWDDEEAEWFCPDCEDERG